MSKQNRLKPQTIRLASWFSLLAGILTAAVLLVPGVRPPWSSEFRSPGTRPVAYHALPALPAGVATRPIEEIRVGDRVLAHNPEIREAERSTWQEPDWRTWLRVALEMPKPDGSVLHVDMIRPRDWFEGDVEAGSRIFLNLPEMGAQGSATVITCEPCPSVEAGDGRVVTATFHHPPSDDVLDVFFEGDQRPLSVTDNHLFWSADQSRFVPVGEMAVGERVRTYSGETKRIVQKLPRPGPNVVYNLEVYGEHVYFVGDLGLLAHNAYTGKSESLGNGLELRTYSIKSSRTGNTYYRKIVYDTVTNKADFNRFAYKQNGSPLVVTINYTGSRLDDFRAANQLTKFGKGAYSHPQGYTWHHIDYDDSTKLGRMVLVRTDVHNAVNHSGGVADYVAATGQAYRK